MSKTTTPDVAMALAVSQDPIFRYALEYLKDHGFELPKMGAAARIWCESQATSGDADAQFVYGEMNVLGLYGEKNDLAAKRWLQRAANQGHPGGLLLLANFIESGTTSETPNSHRAVELITLAAQKGYGPALTQLGVRHLKGIHVTQDKELAVQYLRKAGDTGDVQAQFLLGTNLLKSGNPLSRAEGIDWIAKAAQQGFAGAHRQLGYLYQEGGDGVAQDAEKSRRHFFLAAQIEEDASASF